MVLTAGKNYHRILLSADCYRLCRCLRRWLYPRVTYTDPEQIAAITDSMIQDILSYNAFGMQNNNYIIYLGENDMYPYYNSYMTFSQEMNSFLNLSPTILEEIVKQQNN